MEGKSATWGNGCVHTNPPAWFNRGTEGKGHCPHCLSRAQQHVRQAALSVSPSLLPAALYIFHSWGERYSEAGRWTIPFWSCLVLEKMLFKNVILNIWTVSFCLVTKHKQKKALPQISTSSICLSHWTTGRTALHVIQMYKLIKF